MLQGLGVGLAALGILPVAYLLLRAVQGGSSEALEVLGATETLWALGRSLGLATVMAVLCLALTLPLAWLTHCTDLPGRRAFRVLLNLPLAVPSYVSGFVVIAALGPTGWLRGLGLSWLVPGQRRHFRPEEGANVPCNC